MDMLLRLLNSRRRAPSARIVRFFSGPSSHRQVAALSVNSSPDNGSTKIDRGVGGVDVASPEMTSTTSTQDEDFVCAEVMRFDRMVPVEQAATPPSSWYTSKQFAGVEMNRVFGRGWQVVGHLEQVKKPGAFFSGSVGKVKYVVCRDQEGRLHAFHNVCRHHAAAVAKGSGCTLSFVCPYHGWTYGLDGRLQKATRLGGIQNFSARDYGLHPLEVATCGPFVLISLQSKTKLTHAQEAESEWLGNAALKLWAAQINTSLSHVARREYLINCNWKVYCDNYLDGGYHVPFAHLGLAAGLDFDSYKTEIYERVSIQSCEASGGERLGSRATYAFVYPNFMINRYGPWMDTNLVLPLAVDKCRVVFDYFLEKSMLHDTSFIEDSLRSSQVVQDEDTRLCEEVQTGLDSPVYDVGRYVPKVERAMHHFHCLLHRDLSPE